MKKFHFSGVVFLPKNCTTEAAENVFRFYLGGTCALTATEEVRGRMRYTIKGEGTYEDGARLRNRFMSAMTGWSLAEVVLSDEGGKVCVQCDDSCATDMEGNGTVSILWAR